MITDPKKKKEKNVKRY